MNKRILLLSGTPGTGKTTISKHIGEKNSLIVLNLSKIVQEENLYDEIDEERDTKIVAFDKMDAYLQKFIEKNEGNMIIESHFSDLVENDAVIMGIVLRCHPNKLYERLKQRDYTEKKILENIQAEMVGSCTSHMLENPSLNEDSDIYEIDTSDKTIEEISAIIQNLFLSEEMSSLNLEKQREIYKWGKISWLSDKSVSRRFLTY